MARIILSSTKTKLNAFATQVSSYGIATVWIALSQLKDVLTATSMALNAKNAIFKRILLWIKIVKSVTVLMGTFWRLTSV
jgi:hypothetical protein